MVRECFVKMFPEAGLEKNKTDIVKGILALYLILIHARGNTSLAGITAVNFVLMVSGQLICSYFFFMSGYGLMRSYLAKTDYLKHFLRRHVLRLYVPYSIVLLATVAYRAALLHENIDIVYLLRSLMFGGTYAIYGWYVQVALLVYILFFAVFSLNLGVDTKKKILTCGILGYVAVAIAIGAQSIWYDSVLATMLGVYSANLPRVERSKKFGGGIIRLA